MPNIKINLSKEELEELDYLKKHKKDVLEKICPTCGQVIKKVRGKKEKEIFW